jgi:hypothetical protein
LRFILDNQEYGCCDGQSDTGGCRDNDMISTARHRFFLPGFELFDGDYGAAGSSRIGRLWRFDQRRSSGTAFVRACRPDNSR